MSYPEDINVDTNFQQLKAWIMNMMLKQSANSQTLEEVNS